MPADAIVEETEKTPETLKPWLREPGLWKPDEPGVVPVTEENTPNANANANAPAGAQPAAVGTAPAAAAVPAAPAGQAPVPPGTTAPAAPAAAPAPAVKPAEPAVAPATAKLGDEDESAPPKNKSDWDKFKAKHAERESNLKKDLEAREARLKEFEAKMAELEGKAAKANEVGADKAIFDQMKKENDELRSRIMALDVTQDPRFVSYYDGKTNAQIDLAKRIVGPERAEAIAQALKLPDSPEYVEIKNAQIEEAISELTPLQQSRIGGVLNALNDISGERQSDIAKAAEHKSKLQAQQDQARSTMASTRDKLFEEAVRGAQDPQNGMTIYQYRDGDDQWNAGVKNRIESAKRLLTGQGVDPKNIVLAALHAAAAPDAVQIFQASLAAKDAEIARLNEQVKQMTAARPAGGATATAAQGGVEQPLVKEGMMPHEVAASWAKQMSQTSLE